MSTYHFADVTLLITHYNRSASLSRLLSTFHNYKCIFADVVVSDDGSKPEHLKALKLLQRSYSFRLVTTPVNKGLGNNINKGQDAVKTKYTLYVQEDFVPTEVFGQHFKDAVTIMSEEPRWDIIRFYAYFTYPYKQEYKKGFSEMLFKKIPWYYNHLKFYYYSDHPHLRRSNFFEKFGRYTEGKNGDFTEFQMCLSFIKRKGQGLFFNEFSSLFQQCNNASEPSTATFRPSWRQSKRPDVVFLRWLYLKYRFVKNNFQLMLPE